MKVIRSILITLLFISLVSCGSTKVEKQDKAAKNLNAQETEFIASLADIKLSVLQFPKDVAYGKNFATPYIVQVLSTTGTPVANYSVTIEYPKSKQDKVISFTTTSATTDEKGRITFTPEQPDFSCTSNVSFYPTPVSKKAQVVEACKNTAVQARWCIKSKLISSKSLMFVWEYNEKDKPNTNAYCILADIQNRGASAGNAPITEESYLHKTPEEIYKANYSIVEDKFDYLIYGTLKFVQPVEKTEEGFKCEFISEIFVMDMHTGKIVYTNKYTNTTLDAKYDKAVSNCKKQIAKKIGDDLSESL